VTDESSRATLASRVRGWLPVVITAGVLAVAGVVAIPLGGWDTVQLESEIIPEHPVGEPFTAHRLSVSIDDLYVTDDHPDAYTEVEPGQSFLVLVATMEGLTAEPESPLRSPYPFTLPGWISIDEDPDLTEVTTYLQRDGSPFPTLSPGVPETLLIVFPVASADYSDGDVVRIGITDATPEKADIISGTRWVDEHVAVEVPIAVRDER
jgi:hypothetical protein